MSTQFHLIKTIRLASEFSVSELTFSLLQNENEWSNTTFDRNMAKKPSFTQLEAEMSFVCHWTKNNCIVNH